MAYSKKNMAAALSSTLKKHSDKPLSELLDDLEKAEKQLWTSWISCIQHKISL